jgi:hypothetical protein
MKKLLRYVRFLNNRLTHGDETVDLPLLAAQKIPDGKKAPFAWGKIGTCELLALEYSDRRLNLFFPSSATWRRPAKRLFHNAGVFPPQKKEFFGFLKTYRESLSSLDGVLCWQTDPFLRLYEKKLIQETCPTANLLAWEDLGFQIYERIMNYRWLVVSPFVRTMRNQIRFFHQIHGAPQLESFVESLTNSCCFLECPLSASLRKPVDPDWHSGLIRLTNEALDKQFDIALVGAGAWSLPLLYNLKKAGKSGIHLGGETQLLFGIKGHRWDHLGIYNSNWVNLSSEETPSGYKSIDNGCYW